MINRCSIWLLKQTLLFVSSLFIKVLMNLLKGQLILRWNELGKFLIISLAIIGGFCVYISPLSNSIKQGLDLQGGTHVVLQAVDTPELKVDDDAVNRSVKIIERRVNELGLTEPVIQRQGKDRIIVELPGVKDPDKAIAMLGRTALWNLKMSAGKLF